MTRWNSLLTTFPENLFGTLRREKNDLDLTHLKSVGSTDQKTACGFIIVVSKFCKSTLLCLFLITEPQTGKDH